VAVIIREDKVIGGKKIVGLKIYKSEHLVTRKAKEQADKLDEFIERRMRDIEEHVKKAGLLGSKKEKLRLWYEVGKRLSFVMDASIVPAEDRKYVWRALYDHAGPLAPGPLGVRAAERPETSHFKYCWRLAQYPWEFAESAGNWGAWIAFFDSLVIRNDERIIDWLKTKQKYATGNKQDWLRDLNREIRREFKGRDTSVFSDQELDDRLENIFAKVCGTMEESGDKK
jgi:hypothetical protein